MQAQQNEQCEENTCAEKNLTYLNLSLYLSCNVMPLLVCLWRENKSMFILALSYCPCTWRKCSEDRWDRWSSPHYLTLEIFSLLFFSIRTQIDHSSSDEITSSTEYFTDCSEITKTRSSVILCKWKLISQPISQGFFSQVNWDSSCYITVYYVTLYYEGRQKITTGDVLNTLIHYLFNFYRKVKGNVLTVTLIVLFRYLMLSHSLFETNSLRTLIKVEGVTRKPLGPLA